MDNAEEIFMFLEDFSKRKPKTIPHELNEYLEYVARTGDPIFQWCLVKCLFKEKLLNVLSDFYETPPGINIPSYPNVDPFNYDTLKNSLIERLDSFTSAPFTIQRLCELLTDPRKEYNRIDKYMRAVEKNILVVSTTEPGFYHLTDSENGDDIVNGSDNNSKNNVAVEMEEVTFEETKEQNPEPQPSSSESYSIEEIEAHLRAKRGYSKGKPAETRATPQQVDQGPNKGIIPEQKTSNLKSEALSSTSVETTQNVETDSKPGKTDKMDIDVKDEGTASQPKKIPETDIKDINIDDKKSIDTNKEDVKTEDKEASDKKCETEKPQTEEKNCESETNKDNSDTAKAVMVIEKQVEEKEPTKMETDKPQPIPEKINETTEKSPQVLESKNDSTVDNSELPQITGSDSNESKSTESDQTDQLNQEPKETVEDKTDTTAVEEKVTEGQKTEAKSEKEPDTDKPAAPVE